MRPDLGVDGKITLEWILEEIHLAQVTNQWRALVNTVMSFRVS
jgi:hypothetical protein